jgi:excisionase family DNA binding protein
MSSVLAYTIPEACKASGLGRTSLYKLISAGQLPCRKHGTRTLILESDLRAFLEGLPEHPSPLKLRSMRRRSTAEVRSSEQASGELHPVTPVRGEA